MRRVTCKICKAKLEYDTTDVKTGEYYDDVNDEHGKYLYIVCPDCGSEICV